MRRQRGRVGLLAAALLLVGGGVVGRAAAEVTTERSASILVFPKVVADGTRDTLIQISNTSNSMVHAHCFYVNGALTFPGLPPGPGNPPLWTEVDFDLWLTKQQPTHWVVSTGRVVDPSDPPCGPGTGACDGAGLDPGRVPPVVEDFTGELKCVEVDPSGAPVSGNHLKGEATIIEGAAVARYNALGIIGLETNDGDGVLCLGGEPTDACPNGAEYNACPQTWILDHFAEGAPVPGASGSTVSTDITVVPCAQNFETQVPESVTVQFAVTNEYEQTFSASTTVTCWAELGLNDIGNQFDFDTLGTTFAVTRMRPSAGTASGFLVVGEERYVGAQELATTAFNLHVEGERPGPDLVVIPAEQLQ